MSQKNRFKYLEMDLGSSNEKVQGPFRPETSLLHVTKNRIGRKQTTDQVAHAKV